MKGVEMKNLELEDANALRKYNDRLIGLTADLRGALSPEIIYAQRLEGIIALINEVKMLAEEMKTVSDDCWRWIN
jgi:hypothetical protein